MGRVLYVALVGSNPSAPSLKSLGAFFRLHEMNTPYLPTTLKQRGYFAESRPNGRWLVKGRGIRREMSFEEFHALLNPPRRQKAEAPAK